MDTKKEYTKKVVKDSISHLDICPYRITLETWEEYTKRRAAANKGIKQWLKGRLVWDSFKKGPARRNG